MSKKVLVTGATGFVGANLVRRLLRDGHEVHALVRASRSDWRIHDILQHIRLSEADVAERAAVGDQVKRVRPDWVFHLAAHGGYSSQSDAAQIVETNLGGSMALVDACAETGVEAFVQTGSSSEYGWKDHASSEDERIEPNSIYAITKAAATHYCQLVARTRDVNAITLRLYSIYGPYEEPTRLVPTLLAYGIRGELPPLVSPKTARDFVYVDDAVDALVHTASVQDIAQGSVYNVCTGIQTELDAIVTRVRDLLRIQAEPCWGTMPPRSWDTERWVGDPSKIAREIGWRTATPLREGLEQTAQWLRESLERLAFYQRRISGSK